MEIALVIPVYNEESTIRDLILEAQKYLSTIIAVNDHSTDATMEILQKLPITLIVNKSNLGYTKSLEKGIRTAFNRGADYVITIDGDSQHKPSDLSRFISVIHHKKPDLILGKRMSKNRFMEEIFGLYTKIIYGFSDPLCGMKAYKKDIYIKYGSLEHTYTLGTELVCKAIKNHAIFIEIPIKTRKRKSLARFGTHWTGNLLELRAFLNIIFT